MCGSSGKFAMTNPFADISDPATLRALVQDGMKCERCDGRQWPQVGPDACPVCCGPGKISGKVPLSNADIEALAACWCEGREIYWDEDQEIFVHALHPHRVLAYTTSPDAAMRLQVKYHIRPRPISNGDGTYCWKIWATHEIKILGENIPEVLAKEDTVEALCHAITTAALVAALTEAMEE